MPIDTSQRGSDGWWSARLVSRFSERPRPLGDGMIADDPRTGFTRAQWLNVLWARFTGATPLQQIASEYVEATQELMRLAKVNFAELVVEALQDRTQLVGVRQVDSADTDGDDNARRFLASTGAVFDDAMQFAYVMGAGYAMVSRDGAGEVAATAEDPRQVMVERDPLNPYRIRAAVKYYHDSELEQDRLHLFLPASEGQGSDRVHVAYRNASALELGIPFFDDHSWTWDEDASGALPVQGLGVPIVELPNRLMMGEYERHLPLLDRITNDVADRLWASKYQVFIQRAVMGELPDVDEQGKKIDYDSLFSADPAALWKLPPDAKLWEGRQLDINMLLAPVRDDLKELSATTRTPLHMFTPDAMTGSAEGASLSREGISFKAEDRIKRFSRPAIRFLQLGLAYSGKPYDGEFQAMWAPVERYSLAQKAQAGAQQNGVAPREMIWSDTYQWTPEQVTLARRLRDQELTQTALLAPEQPAAQPNQPATQRPAAPQPSTGQSGG